VIKYKKDNANKLADMLSSPPTSKITNLGTLTHMDPFTHDAYREEYLEDEDFKEVYQSCRVKVMCTMATTPLTTISKMGYYIGWISCVSLKVSICS